MRRLRLPAALLAIGLASIGVGLAPPRAAAADEVSFGKPDAVADYGTAITFTVDVTRSVPLERAELRLRLPDTIGPLIVDVPVPPGTGTTQLQYVLDVTGGGHIVPNTPITATWAAYTAAGADPVVSRDDRVLYQDTTHDWRKVKGDLMTVHWYAGGDAFANKALQIGEKAISDTAALLGVTETEPVDFYIYGDQDSFRAALGPGTRENVGGQAHADIRTLFALITPEEIDQPWVGVVIPHELVHLVFDTAVHNPYRFPPRWLNEGLAVYLSEGYGSQDRGRVESAASANELIPLVALGGQFPTDYRPHVPRLRRVRVGHRLPRAPEGPGRARRPRHRLRRRADRRRGVQARAGRGPRPVPGGLARRPRGRRPEGVRSAARAGRSAAVGLVGPRAHERRAGDARRRIPGRDRRGGDGCRHLDARWPRRPASTSGSSSIGPVLLVLALVVAGVVGVLAIARRRIRTT